MRCLWLTKGLGRGGVERLLVDLYSLFDRTQFEIDVAYVLPHKDAFHDTIEAMGSKVYCLGVAGERLPVWIGRLRALLDEGDYDVVHTHAPVPAIAARFATMGSSRPRLVHTEHNMWDRYHPATRWLNALTYGRNTSVVAVSDAVAGSIDPPSWVPRLPTTTTIRHGTVLRPQQRVTVKERRAKRTALGLPPDAVIIGNVANFTPKKNHEALLQTLVPPGAEHDSLESAHVALVGAGPLDEQLRRRAVELGVAERIYFLGSRDDVFEILPLFDVFCLSSNFEGFPIALVEAMAEGLACVATNAGGIGEILVDRYNGLMVETSDIDGLRSALHTMITDHELADRCGVNARRTAEGLDLRNAATTMSEMYLNALTSSPNDRLREGQGV